jgi:Co/Zn/Cd efflux system component
VQASENAPLPECSVSDLHHKTRYHIRKMDCPSEENLIRMALGALPQVLQLQFFLQDRQLDVVHQGGTDAITQRLESLNLGAVLQSSAPFQADPTASVDNSKADADERKLLQRLLAINAVMFVTELIVGVWAQSTGLIADSLDMLADAAVYSVALLAVGLSAAKKVRAAHLSGWLQALLAAGVLFEVARRFWAGTEPMSTLMIVMASVALIANTLCLYLISQSRSDGAHMKATKIFSTNDVLANLGVIVAGGLVAWTGSGYPDLVIGGIIGIIVLDGARRILALRT